MSNSVEFQGETYTTNEPVFNTPDGLVFLPKIAVSGEYVAINEGSPEDLILRSAARAECLNALDAIEVFTRQNGTIAVFVDLESDVDLNTDIVGTGADLKAAVASMLEQVWALEPDSCICKNPADDPRFA